MVVAAVVPPLFVSQVSTKSYEPTLSKVGVLTVPLMGVASFCCCVNSENEGLERAHFFMVSALVTQPTITDCSTVVVAGVEVSTIVGFATETEH